MTLRRHAKALRTNMTVAERKLWYILRAHRFKGIKIKRQARLSDRTLWISYRSRDVLFWKSMMANMRIAHLMRVEPDGWKIKGSAFCGSGIMKC
ncbi:MAG TPA: DUF559 domain-containing protein [Bradyrhizobium sp.]